MKDKRIILIGAGNVAHHLAPALLKAGLNLCQIYSRSIESARELGRKTGITYTADLFGIYPDGDIYIFCVSDDALLSLFKSIRINKEAIILHTSGSLPMDIFKPYVTYYGVLYPLQTFTKKRDLDFVYRGFESGGSGSAPGIDKTLVGESRGNFFREKENFALGCSLCQ